MSLSFGFIFLDQTSPTYLAIHFSVTKVDCAFIGEMVRESQHRNLWARVDGCSRFTKAPEISHSYPQIAILVFGRF